MARPLKQILVNYDKAFYVRKGIRQGEACYKVICCRNYYTWKRGSVEFRNTELNKETVLGVYTDLREAEMHMERAALFYVERIEKGEV